MPKNNIPAKYDMDTLVLPADVTLLEDNKQYTNRVDFVSGSGKEYRLAQNKSGRWWACSCPSYKFKTGGTRHCKHMEDFGIPGEYAPFEIGNLQIGGAPPKLTALPGGSAKKAPKAKSPKAKAPKAKGPKASPLAIPAVAGIRPKGVVTDPKTGDITVTFAAKDAAAVYSLLSQLTGGVG